MAFPYGYCHCGCGEKTKPAKQTDRALGWRRGEPIRFINGHAGMGSRQERPPITFGEIEGESVAFMPLTKKRVAIVDLGDEVKLSGTWCFSSFRYAIQRDPESGSTRSMHRVLLDLKAGEQADHINGNGLDNRKSNLRVTTQMQNLWNTGLRSDNKSGMKGVWWLSKNNKWQARITVNKAHINLGLFVEKEQAIAARLAAEVKWHGEYARRSA